MEPCEFTVVIPTYSGSDELSTLIGEIFDTTTEKHRPSRILIVDDGSFDDTRYVHKTLSTRSLPIDCLELPQQVGFPLAAKAGMDVVDTPYAVLMHSDITLTGKPKFKQSKTPSVIPDPIGAITTYVTSDPEIAMVAPFSLIQSRKHLVYGGMRMAGNNKIPHSRFRASYFEPLRNIGFYRWFPIHSADHCCVAINMNAYDDLPFEDECGHFFFFDDWCTGVREKGYFLYMTTDAVVYHPLKKDKPEGSRAIPDDDNFSTSLRVFQEKWMQKPLWELNSPRKVVAIEDATVRR